MSSRHNIQDATGRIEFLPGKGSLEIYCTGAPSAQLGSPGCVAHRVDGGAGTALYVNEGTASSPTWVPVLTPSSTPTLASATITALTTTTITVGGIAPLLVSGNAPVVVNAASLTLAPATHANRLVVLSGTTANAGVAITPPAATGTGDLYTIVFGSTVSSNTTTFDAKAGNASDVFYGWIQTYKATTFTPYITASNSNLMTFDGSTRGGIKGDRITFRDAATNVWLVEGFTTQSGTIATPFSNH